MEPKRAHMPHAPVWVSVTCPQCGSWVKVRLTTMKALISGKCMRGCRGNLLVEEVDE